MGASTSSNETVQRKDTTYTLHLQKLTDVPVDVFHIEDRITRHRFITGFGSTWILVVAGRTGAVQVPVIDQEEHEGSAALPSKHTSESLSALLSGHVSIDSVEEGRHMHCPLQG